MEAVKTPALTWRFPKAFWVANVIELFERAAFYGLFIALALFLTDVVGFTDVEAGWIAAGFAGGINLLPFATGTLADRLGFRVSLTFAFSCLAVGYATVGLFPVKPAVPFGLLLVCIGGAFVKPIIAGTVSISSDGTNRARAFSLFYMMVNIGSFTGKTIAKPVRAELGLQYIPLYSGAVAAVALVLVILFYRPKASAALSKGFDETVRGFKLVLRNGRFMALILITSGFWAIQGQMYASMPKYVLRMVGDSASPEWYANVNPAVVVLCVVPITQLVKRWKPITSILLALAIIPFSALTMSFAHVLAGTKVSLAGLHPVTVTMLAGIALQGFAECFLSPRYLEYASKQAPAGQEGLFMGYAQLNTFFAWLFGFIASGYLLQAFCPDPKSLSPDLQAQRLASLAGQGPMPEQYAHAHYLWFTFAGVGFVALVLLMLLRATEKAPAAGVA
jgi:dipeptide/tripeptide permease